MTYHKKFLYKKRPIKSKNSFFDLMEKIATLSISIVALIISICSFNSANNQFESNSIESEKAFKVQNEINTNLLNELIKISETSEKQLIDQVNAASPQVIFKETTILDTDKSSNGLYSPLLNLPFVNNGKRTAFNCTFRAFIVYKYNDTFNINIPPLPLNTIVLDPNDNIHNELKPKLHISNKDDFYLVKDIKYFDAYTNKWFYKSEFLHFITSRSKQYFIFCHKDEIIFLISFINTQINQFNLTSEYKLDYIKVD